MNINSLLEKSSILLHTNLIFSLFSKVTALQSEKGRGTATVQQIGGGGDSVVLGETSLYIFKAGLI